MPKSDLIYFASPYSHPDESVRVWYYLMAKLEVISMLQDGFKVISPIVYTHELYRTNPDLGMSHEKWRGLNEAFMDASGMLLVYQLPGWLQSVGIMEERTYMYEQDKPINYNIYTPRKEFPCPQSIIHLS